MEALARALRDLVAISGNDVHKCLSHSAVPGDEEIDIFIGRCLEELLVDILYRRLNILGSHDNRNVSFRRTLRHGTYTDASASQGSEHAPRRTALIYNVIANQADNREAGLHLQRIQLAK